jgi:hypothetical protein
VHYHLDDTTNRIVTQKPVDKPNRRTGKLQSRSGIYTSGVLATLAGGEICVLYQTNIGHAGEWLDEILATRSATAAKPIIMSDALSANRSYALKEYHLSLCNAHARRGTPRSAYRFGGESPPSKASPWHRVPSFGSMEVTT